MIRNIIFDYGKVLLNWNPHFLFDDYFGNREKADHFIDDILCEEWFNDGDIGTPMAQVVEKWAGRYPEYADAFRFYIDEFMQSIRDEVPGMYDYISSLRERGYHVYGLSNWSWELFQDTMKKYRIFSLMEGMVVSGKVHMLKPHPEIYRRLLNDYSLDPAECVFVDDRQQNIDGAIAVGIKGILFTDQPSLERVLEPLLAEQ